MTSKQISQLFLGFGLTAALMCVAPAYGNQNAGSEIAQLKALSSGFASVGKKAIPAVVSIRTKIEPKKSSSSNNPYGRFEEDDSQDLFLDQFWGRFFNFKGNESLKPQIQEGQASGFLVSTDGYILTNGHVVEDTTELTVVLNDGREFLAKVIGQDQNTDVALIKIDAKDLPALRLGNSDNLQPGEWVIAIGSPFQLQATLTVGVISATGRSDLSIARIEDFIQTDAAINRGNSGGPLLNLDGEVIGINTAIATNVSAGYMGIGFAIPSNIAKHVMDQILTNGKVTRGFLGVTLQKLNKDLAAAFHLDNHEGALIADIAKGTPAEKAGLLQGDVIIKMNGNHVSNIASLRNAIALMTPGTKVAFIVLRNGKPMEFNIEIADFPTEPTLAKGVTVENNELGITVDNMSAGQSQKLGLNGRLGVIVKSVDSNSIAAWVGLRKGAVILEVNKQKIDNVEGFTAALKDVVKGQPILLLIKQGDIVQYLSIKSS